MRRFLVIIALFACFSLPSLAQTWSTLPVDVLVSMNTSTPGTAITTTIANAGTVSNGGTCTWASMNSSIVGANQGVSSNLGPVQINGAGGTLFAAQSLNFNNIGHDDTAHNTNNICNLPGGHNNVTATALIYPGWVQENNGTDWDEMIIWGTGGFYAVVQQNSSCQGNQEPGVRMETSVTNHSGGCVGIPSHQPFYVSLNHNCGAGTASMWIFTVEGTVIGHTTQAVTGESGQTCNQIYIGNNEAGNCTGNPGCSGAGQEYTYFQNLMINWTTHPDPLFWTDTSLGAGVLAPGRKPASAGSVGWSGLAGVVGGIPNRTNICSSLTSSATTAQIDAAIASCSTAGGGVVSLGAGTFIAGACAAGNSNVTLRGAGANQTTLAPTGSQVCRGFGGGQFVVGVSSADGNFKTTIANGPVAITGILNPGSNTITLASVPNLKVGNPIILDELDDVNDGGGILVAQSTTTATGSISPGLNGPYSTGGNAGGNIRCPSSTTDTTCFGQEQIVTVTQCDGVSTLGHACASGANITISPGLHMPNWTSAKTPSAWWSSSPVLNFGVEDMTLDATNCSSCLGLTFFNAANSWAKGVMVIDTGEAHILFEYAQHITVMNSYLFLTQYGNPACSLGCTYGFETNGASDILIENNINQAVTSPRLTETADGLVMDYNFAINNLYPANPGTNINDFGGHSVGTAMILDEGNFGDLANWDFIHGTHNFITSFRNLYFGNQPVCASSGTSTPYASMTYGACNTNSRTPLVVRPFTRMATAIGNVLGQSNNSGYSYNGSSDPGNEIICEGCTFGGNVVADPNVASTLMLWGNADAITGFSSPRFNCSEVPVFPVNTTPASSYVVPQFPYINGCPANHTLPPSLFYSSKPSWWPSGKPWPAIGPDVTGGNVLQCTSGTWIGAFVNNASLCAGGTSAVWANGTVYSNPAMDCYYSLGGNPYGTGPALTNFNEQTCYSTLAFNPSPVAFGNQNQGTTSSPITVTVTNNSSAADVLSTPYYTITGANAGDFANTGSGTCANGGTITASGGSCTVVLTFTPSTGNSESATLTIQGTLNGTDSITGTGIPSLLPPTNLTATPQ